MTCNFDMDALLATMARINPQARVLQMSSLTGDGVDDWCGYLRKLSQPNMTNTHES